MNPQEWKPGNPGQRRQYNGRWFVFSSGRWDLDDNDFEVPVEKTRIRELDAKIDRDGRDEYRARDD